MAIRASRSSASIGAMLFNSCRMACRRYPEVAAKTGSAICELLLPIRRKLIQPVVHVAQRLLLPARKLVEPLQPFLKPSSLVRGQAIQRLRCSSGDIRMNSSMGVSAPRVCLSVRDFEDFPPACRPCAGRSQAHHHPEIKTISIASNAA